MDNSSLNNLISKLNPLTNQSLEAAVGLCAARSQFNTEIEHWLAKLLESDDNEIALILTHFSADKMHILNTVYGLLDDFKTGNTRTPTLSPNLIEWLSQAWSLASLQLNLTQISSGTLLFALLNDNFLARQAFAISNEFKKINLAELQENFAAIIKNAKENTTNKPNVSNTKNQTALQQFTIDLTELAQQGKIDPVIGRDKEIRQMIDILLRRRQNNPILTGEAGVGKTAVVEGLALAIVNKEVPEVLADVHIHILDLALLQAGASVKGEFENRLKAVIEAVKQSNYPIILFIDEAHNLIGAGNQAGQGDAANLLKPALARGELRTIAATTWAEYKKFFEKDAALTRRFQVVKVEEPDEATAIAIMRGLANTLEQHHQVTILDEALVSAVQLSKRYLPSRQLPDKAISLLDTACARAKLSQTTTPQTIESFERDLKQLENTREKLLAEQARGIQHDSKLKELSAKEINIKQQLTVLLEQWEQEKIIVNNIHELETQLAQIALNKKSQRSPLLKQLENYKKQLHKLPQLLLIPHVNTQIIAEVLANWTGIPLGRMLKTEIDNLLNLENELKQRVMGQDHAISLIAQSIHTARANLADPRKPKGVFLLLGSSGIGKTETALALADLLYSGKQSLTVINMSEFKEEHKISMLTGSPAGYVGYGEGGLLTEAVRRKPYNVILLDEMEKAHRGVQDIFYQVFDKGILFDGEGREVDFKNTIILMTSNVGSDIIIRHQQDDDLKDKLQPALLSVFKPAFLSRLTVVPYLPLNQTILTEITQLQLNKISERLLQNYQATFSYDDNLINYIIQNCQQVEGGARNIENLIANQILPKLSIKILKTISKKDKIKSVRLSLRQDQNLCIHVN